MKKDEEKAEDKEEEHTPVNLAVELRCAAMSMEHPLYTHSFHLLHTEEAQKSCVSRKLISSPFLFVFLYFLKFICFFNFVRASISELNFDFLLVNFRFIYDIFDYCRCIRTTKILF